MRRGENETDLRNQRGEEAFRERAPGAKNILCKGKSWEQRQGLPVFKKADDVLRGWSVNLNFIPNAMTPGELTSATRQGRFSRWVRTRPLTLRVRLPSLTDARCSARRRD